MKKFLASLLATAALLFAGAANAGAISSTNAVGMPGDTVQLDVSLASGDISFGGDFTITFSNPTLTVVRFVGRNDADYTFQTGYEFFPCCDPTPGSPFITGGTVFVSYIGAVTPAQGPIDSIFSILFLIANPYSPAAGFPDVTTVTIDGYLFDANSNTVALGQAITPTITVTAPNNIPEPTALALVGLALLVMVGVGRRSRMRRG